MPVQCLVWRISEVIGHGPDAEVGIVRHKGTAGGRKVGPDRGVWQKKKQKCARIEAYGGALKNVPQTGDVDTCSGGKS